MENFFSLRAEKQKHIIDAALTVFGHNVYKKASIADIANEAGIAKGMVTYYFGSKKNLYMYLIELCGKIMVEEIEKNLNSGVTDFFDKIKTITDIKIAVLRRQPNIGAFLKNVYYETDNAVVDDVKKYISASEGIREKLLIVGTDVSKFKDDIDPTLLEKFLIWTGEGFANTLPAKMDFGDIDAFVDEYCKCLDIMKKHFYKDT